MKTRFFALAALALSLAACTQDELADDNRLPEGEYPVVIRATGLSVEATPQAAPSTRATVDGDWQGVQTVAIQERHALTHGRPALLDQPRPDYRIGMVAHRQG